jgi:hypothetical protein
MVNEKLLIRYDPTGKRGSRVTFSLTEKGKREFHLRILGTNKQTEKRKSLYQLLIFFEEFVRRDFITERQLNRFLRQIGASINELREIKVSHASYPKITYFKSIKGVGIARWIDHDSELRRDRPSYYVTIPGFTVKEVTSYLKKLKTGKEPRPFLYYRGITDVPFTSYIDYTEKEIKDAINTLVNDGLFNQINEVFPGEMRFSITNEHLRSFINDVWDVHLLDLRIFDEELAYNKKPTDEDTKYLTLLYGKKNAERILALTYPARIAYKKEIRSNKEKDKLSKQFIKQLEESKISLMEYIAKTHEILTKQYEIVSGLALGILHS